MFYAYTKQGFHKVGRMSWGKKLLVVAAMTPIVLASIPLIVFMLYRAAKTAREFEKAASLQDQIPNIRIEGEIIDIAPQKKHIHS